ncbi:MAG: phosphatase PAP2 family protein [Candidatus Dormibacteria bacterium]
MGTVSRLRRPGPLVVIAIAYLIAASGIMIWRGISVSPDYILLLAVPIALLSGHVFRFLRDWIPFIAIYLGYEALRGIADKTGIAPHVNDIAGIETAIFGGHVPSAVLQAATPGALGRALAYLATVVYFSHFVFPFGVGLILWLANRTQFLRYTVGLMGMAFLGFFVFLLLPTAPPWYAENAGVIHGVTKLLGTTLPSAISPFYQTLYTSLLSDPVAAFPSLHVGFPFLSFLALRGVFPRAGWIAFVWTMLVAFSVVYLGEHWVVDVLGGMLFAGLSWAALMRFVVPRVRVLQHVPPSLETDMQARPADDRVQETTAVA